ncbi:MAG: ribonuclease HI [Aphanocapsa feldmannii 277cV]|uniref:Ribonuclease H n=1 Tax=Aphanocapsa feldmannii 277cV TaxID=2507553 RepID=A0A524RQH9_9CHRO|nr:MAG: ribonuclease HI [Aphanocapsa feldmannii 277cV]
MAAQQPLLVMAASDGACSGNPGPGGWGCLLRFSDGGEEEMGGHEPHTTNNRMELQAALRVLQRAARLPRSEGFAIRTDSRYLINGYTSWIKGWKRKGWRTAAGKQVLNRDLWEALDEARLPDVPLIHVKGHSGDRDNDRVDAIAVAFSQNQQPRLAHRADGPTADTTKHQEERAAAAGPSAGPDSDTLAGLALAVDPAPRQLAGMLTRLELADRLAKGAYGLSLEELARLVEQPLARLEGKTQSWRWRDWMVMPGNDGRWSLRRVSPETLPCQG